MSSGRAVAGVVGRRGLAFAALSMLAACAVDSSEAGGDVIEVPAAPPGEDGSGEPTPRAAPEVELQRGVPQTNLGGAHRAELRFRITVPGGASDLRFSLGGGAGEADLYVRFGAAPTPFVYDGRSAQSGNTESLAPRPVRAGTYYVLVRGRRAFSAATLMANFEVPPAPPGAAGLRVSGRHIVEANGASFIMRGVNHPHAWFTQQTGAFANIKRLGANTVRVVLTGSSAAADIANVIALCKQHRLICVLENHDTTGHGDQRAITLDEAVSFWIARRNVLAGEESYVVINIGNEPFGNNGAAGWTAATISAIQRMRSSGFGHLLMVDAPNWGQDWTGTMRGNAPRVFAADAQRNTVFSVHMYGVYDTASEISSYLSAFQRMDLPLVIGEFGHLHSDGDPDEDAIVFEARSRGIGYLGWSWSGNSGGVEYLDMTNGFNVDSLTWWGDRIFNGSDGIRATAREATIYSGGGAERR